MGNRLHVGNLSGDATASSLRACFGECGEVCDVQLGHGHEAGHSRTFALITMKTEEAAHAAIGELNGVVLDGSRLRVNDADATLGRAPQSERKVRIALQFRERHNMAYDLDCAGVPLILRVFPSEGETQEAEEWRVEARATEAADAIVVTATAATRVLALCDVARRWRDTAASFGLPAIDWDGVARVMSAVNAV
jgi:hypothetical protein